MFRLVLVLCLGLALSGCGQQSNQPAEGEAEGQPVRTSMVHGLSEHPSPMDMPEWFRRLALVGGAERKTRPGAPVAKNKAYRAVRGFW